MDRIINSDRLITVSDRPSLVYLNAFINESQRMGNIVPNNVTHKTTRDVQIGDYLIPKNTAIVPQISTLFVNEKVCFSGGDVLFFKRE